MSALINRRLLLLLSTTIFVPGKAFAEACDSQFWQTAKNPNFYLGAVLGVTGALLFTIPGGQVAGAILIATGAATVVSTIAQSGRNAESTLNCGIKEISRPLDRFD